MVIVIGRNEPKARVRICSIDVRVGVGCVEGGSWVEAAAEEEEVEAIGHAPLVLRANIGAFRWFPVVVVVVVAFAVIEDSIGLAAVIVPIATAEVEGCSVPPPPVPG